jgi:hypothetical protein
MTANRTIGGDGSVFIDCDVTLRFEILRDGIPFNAVGWENGELLFDVRHTDFSPTPLLQKQPVILGTFSPDRSLNQQRAVVQIDAADWAGFKEQPYRYSLKRMLAGSETVLFWGDLRPQKATAPKQVSTGPH